MTEKKAKTMEQWGFSLGVPIVFTAVNTGEQWEARADLGRAVTNTVFDALRLTAYGCKIHLEVNPITSRITAAIY